MKLKNLILRNLTFVRRGYSSWLGFILSFSTFVTVIYNLVIERFVFLKVVFPSFTSFSVIAILVVVVVSNLIGRFDYQRGAVPIEASLSAKANPMVDETIRAQMLQNDGMASYLRSIGRTEEAEKFDRATVLLSHWLRD